MPSMMRGHLLKIMTPLQGRGYAITLAHPEGLYMQIHRRIRRELIPSGEFGEWIEDAALHNPLPHLQLTRQKTIKRVHSRSLRWTSGSPRILLVLDHEFESRRGEILNLFAKINKKG